MSEETVVLSLGVVKETKRSFLLTDGDSEEWVPKSQISHDESEIYEGECYTFTFPEWLAIEKGFV